MAVTSYNVYLDYMYISDIICDNVSVVVCDRMDVIMVFKITNLVGNLLVLV